MSAPRMILINRTAYDSAKVSKIGIASASPGGPEMVRVQIETPQGQNAVSAEWMLPPDGKTLEDCVSHLMARVNAAREGNPA